MKLTLPLLLFILFPFCIGAQQVSSLLFQYKQAKNSNEKTKAFKNIGEKYSKPYKVENETLLQNDIADCIHNKDLKSVAILKTFQASLECTKGLFDRSNAICAELLENKNQYLDEVLHIKIILIQGFNAAKKLNLTISNQKFIEARDFAIKSNNIEDRISAELGLLSGFLFVRQPDKALAELERIQQLFPEDEKEIYLSKLYRIKSTCYLLKAIKGEKKYEKEMRENFEKCVELSVKQDDQLSLLGCYFSMGLYYNGEANDTSLSKKYLLKAVEAGKQTGSFREIYIIYNYLIQNSIRANHLEEAEDYAKESISASEGLDLEELRMEKYYSLAGIYLKKKEEKKVLDMIDSVRSCLISSFNKRFDVQYAELQTKYETSEKQKQITILDKENQLKKLIIQQQKNRLNQKELEDLNRKNEIALLSKDKILLFQNNELLNNQNELNSISLQKNELELKHQREQQEKQQVVIDKLHTTEKYEQLKNTFIYSILILLLLLLALVYWWLRHKQKQKNLLEKQRYEVELLESKLATYSAQMNPHFLFNSMNAVNHFILKKNPQEASSYLTKFSKLMRDVLENSTHKLISLEDELITLKLYIEMEQLRFPQSFSYKLIVDKNLFLDDISIPPLVLQPFVENAICHGFLHKESKGELTIEIIETDNQILCSIDDDGVGRNYLKKNQTHFSKNHKSMGADITTSRLKINNPTKNANEVVKYIDKKDEAGNSMGTRVEIWLPA